jgi:hypothetical protein
MGWNESNSKREIYSNNYTLRKTKSSNKFIPQETRKKLYTKLFGGME